MGKWKDFVGFGKKSRHTEKQHTGPANFAL